MPALRERIANFLAPRPEATIKPGQEIAYSESLFNSGSTAYKFDPDSLRSRKGHNIYNRMMLDEQVKAVVRFRRDAITGREYFFQFDQAVDLSEDEKDFRIRLFNNTVECMDGSFTDALNGIMSGVWQGFSIAEKVHNIIEFESKPYIGIQAIKNKPYESFRFNVDRFGNILRLEQDIEATVTIVPIEKVIHYVQNPEMDEHYGGSELREAYRSWFSKDIAIKFWNIYLERSAGGIWLAQPREGHILVNGSTEHTDIKNVLSNLSASSAVLLPSSIELTHIMPNSTSEYREAIEFHDLSIAKSLLVPNLLGISHTGQTGSFSQSQTQFKAFTLVLEADSVRLQSLLNEQLFRELGELNFADKIYPQFKFKPLSIEQIIETMRLWNELVGKDTVEPSDTDEAHIRNLLEMPEKGEPLPRRPATQPFQAPDPQAEPGQPNQNLTPDDVDAMRDQAAWKLSFTKAEKRVRFMVIDKTAQDDVVVSVDKMDLAQARNVAEAMVVIIDQRLGTASGDVDAVGKLHFTAPQKTRIKNVSKQSLQKGWKTGQKHAKDEIDAAQKTDFRAQFDRLADRSAEYFNSKSFMMSGNLTGETEAIIKNVLTNGIKFSWTTDEVVDNIYKTLVRKGMMKSATAANAMNMTEDLLLEALEGAGLTPHRLQTMIRTNYFEALNEARYNFFTDPDLGDFVEAMEYSAILDSKTTAICNQLDGRIFSKGSPNWEQYRPPNHFNCRSVLIAVTQNDTWEESRDPTIDPQEGFGTK